MKHLGAPDQTRLGRLVEDGLYFLILATIIVPALLLLLR